MPYSGSYPQALKSGRGPVTSRVHRQLFAGESDVALDAGVMSPGVDRASSRKGAAVEAADPLVTADTLGAAFRYRREARGQTLDQLALITRIRPQYLAALEAMRLDELPSRPFAVGYVRAYAEALDLDAEHAVARYRREAPERASALTAPVGVERRADPRGRLLVVLGAVALAAIVAWNIAQHLMSHGAAVHRPTSVAAVKSSAPPRSPGAPLSLGAPLPPPPESTTPEPYSTPGMDKPAASGSSAPPPAAATPAPVAGTPFEARGAVYGAPAASAAVILQADKPTSFVVRGGDGTVYFARQLEAGESYGAPTLQGLTVEVSNAATVTVFARHRNFPQWW